MNPHGVTKLGPEAIRVVVKLKETRMLPYTKSLEALARGWLLLTREQQERCLVRPAKKSKAQVLT